MQFENENTQGYVGQVYPNMPTLIVMLSAGYMFEIPTDVDVSEIIDSQKLLKRLWYPVMDEHSLKNQAGDITKPKLWQRRQEWLRPCRINEEGCIESRDINGEWWEVEMYLVSVNR